MAFRRALALAALCFACGEADAQFVGEEAGVHGATNGGGASCGDGRITANETCDDGGRTSGDGCSSICSAEPGFTCAGSPSSCLRDAFALPPRSAALYYRADDTLHDQVLTSAMAGVGTITNLGSTSSGDLTQGTSSAKPIIEANCIGSHACYQLNGPSSQTLHARTGAFTAIAQPFTICTVAVTSTGGSRYILTDGTNGLGPITSGHWAMTGDKTGHGLAVIDGGAGSTSFDVVCGVFNGASSKLCVNGTCTTGDAQGTSDLGQFEFGCVDSTCSTGGQLQKRVAEVGVWSGDDNVASRFYDYARGYYGAAPVALRTASAIRTCVIGTSITVGTGDTELGGWSARLQQLLGDGYSIVKFAAGGRTSSQMVTAWEGSVKGTACEYLYIEGAGLNDVLSNSTDAATIYSNIITMCTEAHADTSGDPKGITVIVGTVTPSNAYVGWSADKQAIFDTLRSTELASLATDCPGVILADIHNSLGDASDAEKLGAWTSTSDGLHPGPEGHAAMANKYFAP